MFGAVVVDGGVSSEVAEGQGPKRRRTAAAGAAGGDGGGDENIAHEGRPTRRGTARKGHRGGKRHHRYRKVKAQGGEVRHVLAFGDSLTFGGFGSKCYPSQLEELLNKHSQGRAKYQVHNVGICGESTAEMVVRLPQELEQLAKEVAAPAFVLVLGGTNDLGHLSPEQILGNHTEMRTAIAKAGARCVTLTIPQNEQGLDPVARVVNLGLLLEAEREGGPLLADISVVPQEHLSDGVHFNSEGYAMFAKLVFEVMKPFL